MKKCSQTHHHSLTELNITPLLDLAFVLLVIFIITTTPIVNDLDLNLPSAARRDKEPPAKANYVSVTGNGSIFLNKQETDIANLHAQLVELRTADPDLSVIVRGDSKTRYERIVDILDLLQQANVLKVNLATEPLKEGEL
jgi:biopolymer transport protein ExbD